MKAHFGFGMVDISPLQIERKRATSPLRPGAELAIVVPTFNERANVPLLIGALRNVLEHVGEWEVIVVDDNSPDHTARLVNDLAQRDARIRCVRRVGRRGLSSAVVEGVLATSAPYVVVMDADLQHDETLVPLMLQELRSGAVDVVIGSRYVDGGGTGNWDSERARISRLATKAAQFVMRAPVKDVMSGYFGMTRTAFELALPRLSTIGFKILLDLFASAPFPLRYKELPYTFRLRKHGESKLDQVAIWEYGLLLIDKRIGHLIPARFVSFSVVGAFGAIVHFAVVTALFQGFGIPFVPAQLGGTIIAITSNFLLNNALTYSDRRLRGFAMLRGWILFLSICSVGATANVGLAGWLYGAKTSWILSSISGIIIGAVWNYIMSSAYTWRVGSARS